VHFDGAKYYLNVVAIAARPRTPLELTTLSQASQLYFKWPLRGREGNGRKKKIGNGKRQGHRVKGNRRKEKRRKAWLFATKS